MKDGTIALSSMKATLLVKRGNKYYPPENEKVAKPAKAKSTESNEKNFVNSNPQPPKLAPQFVDENSQPPRPLPRFLIDENFDENDDDENNFMDIFD